METKHKGESPTFLTQQLPSKQQGESSTFSTQQLPSVVNPNTRITPSLFNCSNYEDWAYSVKMAIGGTKRYIDESIKEPDPKYSDWVSENKLVINWILN